MAQAHGARFYIFLGFVAAFIAVFPQYCRAGAPVILAEDGRQTLSGRMDVLEDPVGRLGIADVVSPQRQGDFRPLPRYLAAGFSHSAFWLRFSLQCPTSKSCERLLEVDMPYLDHVDLYAPAAGGGFLVTKTGDRLPFATRPIAHRNFVFALMVQAGEPQTFYLRVHSTSTVVVQTKIWELHAFAEAASREGVTLGLVHGATLAILLFSFVQYMLTRQVVYGYYTLYILFVEVLFASINGYSAQFLFPTLPAISDALVGLTTCASVGAGLYLASPILNVAHRVPWLHRSYRIVGALVYAASATVFIDQYRVVAAPVQLAFVYVGVAQILVAARMVVRGEREGITYLAAFGIQIAMFVVIILRNIGLITSYEVLELAPQFGGVLHMVLISLGLAQRILAAEREKRAALAALLDASQRHQRELEDRVAERTAELSAANQGLAAEVVERQAAEAALRESEAHLRTLLNAAPFPMLVSNLADGRLLFLNGPAEDLLGVAPGSGVGLHAAVFHEDQDKRQRILDRLRTEGTAPGIELALRRADGERRWVLAAAVRFHYGSEDAIMVCLNDISSRMELERARIKASERLEAALVTQGRAMREQRNFLAMVSHEFRTPLAIISSAGDVLELKRGQDEVVDDHLMKIRRAVLRLIGLIDSCLADEWLDATMEGLRLQPVDLAAMLAELRDERALIAPQRLVLSRPADAVEIEADPVLLGVLFSNIIDNAIKYSPVNGEIRIAVTEGKDWVVATVADDGPGIAAEDTGHVFEKFYRAKAAMGRGGAGLGLHLVKRIVERHYGSVELHSGTAGGATFTVRLPRAQEAGTLSVQSVERQETQEIAQKRELECERPLDSVG